jgi:hypothetical protein
MAVVGLHSQRALLRDVGSCHHRLCSCCFDTLTARDSPPPDGVVHRKLWPELSALLYAMRHAEALSVKIPCVRG